MSIAAKAAAQKTVGSFSSRVQAGGSGKQAARQTACAVGKNETTRAVAFRTAPAIERQDRHELSRLVPLDQAVGGHLVDPRCGLLLCVRRAGGRGGGALPIKFRQEESDTPRVSVCPSVVPNGFALNTKKIVGKIGRVLCVWVQRGLNHISHDGDACSACGLRGLNHTSHAGEGEGDVRTLPCGSFYARVEGSRSYQAGSNG